MFVYIVEANWAEDKQVISVYVIYVRIFKLLSCENFYENIFIRHKCQTNFTILSFKKNAKHIDVPIYFPRKDFWHSCSENNKQQRIGMKRMQKHSCVWWFHTDWLKELQGAQRLHSKPDIQKNSIVLKNDWNTSVYNAGPGTNSWDIFNKQFMAEA